MDYHTNGNDLGQIIDEYNHSPDLYEQQKKYWPQITRKQFGRPDETHNPEALLWLRELGGDNQPVGSLAPRSAVRFFQYTQWHVFPPERDIVRFGLFMQFNLYRTLHLVLKLLWEIHFGRNKKHWRSNNDSSLLDALKPRDENEMIVANTDFEPDNQFLFNLFEENNGFASEAGYDLQSFDVLVKEMINNHLHWVPNASQELEFFINREIERLNDLKEGSEEEKEIFWISRLTWNQKQKELDDFLLSIESYRLKNSNTIRQWNVIFGELELQLLELIHHSQKLLRYLELKQADPKLSLKEIETKCIEMQKEVDREFSNRAYEVFTAHLVDKPEMSELSEIYRFYREHDLLTEPDSQKQREYQNECRKLIREIYKLTHPDHLKSDPEYEKLTEKQKEKLNQVLLEALRIKPEELCLAWFTPERMRSKEGLQMVLDEVQEILKNAGIDIKVHMVIQGETIPDKLNWLEKEITRLEDQIEQARAVLDGMVNQGDILQKNEILQNHEIHEDIKQDIIKETEEYRKKADEIEAKLRELFNDEGAE